MASKMTSKHTIEARSKATAAPPDYEAAYRELVLAIEEGDPEALYALGTSQLHGIYLAIDQVAAVDHIRRAADQDYPPALFDLAVCFEKGVGLEESSSAAFELYVRAALAGDHQAFYEVGRCWYYGIGIAANQRLSEVWMEAFERRQNSNGDANHWAAVAGK